jgi:hypothetical protein
VSAGVIAAQREQDRTWAELQAKWHDWAWKICQRSDADADRARAALVVAIGDHHAASRALIAVTMPGRARTLSDRPATSDEITYPSPPSRRPRPGR